MSAVRMLFALLAMVVATVAIGWIGVPVAAIVYTIVVRKQAAPIETGLGAALGWGAMYLVHAGNSAFSLLLARLGGIFPVPGAVVLVIACLFAALLAWSSARFVLGIVGTRVKALDVATGA